MADGSTPRTRRELTRRYFATNFLGALSTLEEIAVAVWMLENGVQFIYQAPVGNFRNQLWTDFLLIYTSPRICIEVDGDKWHSGVDQQAADRSRAIALAQTGLLVVPVYGHDIVGGYPGWPIPTDDSFNRIMDSAVRGVQLSTP